MTPALVMGLALLTAAVWVFGWAVLADTSPRISRRRRGAALGDEPEWWRSTTRAGVGLVDSALVRRGRTPISADELELAGIMVPIATFVSTVFGLAVVVGVTGFVIGGPTLAVVAIVGAPIAGKMYVRLRTERRRKAFADQLERTLTLLASSLRAGQSLPMALDTISRDSESPTRDEFARILNENRIGRDLVEAMEATADRMECEDFRWLTEAVAVQRDSGGNLNQIIDRVAETIRERAELRGKIHAYSAEGRLTVYILMALPIAAAILYSIITPGYMSPLFGTGLGRILLAVSAVMFAVGWAWMRAIVNVKL